MDFSRVVDGFKADVMGRVLQDGLGSVQTGPAGGRQSQGQVLLGSARFWSAQPVCNLSVCNLSVCLQERRPFLASECSDLPKAEKWRRQVCVQFSCPSTLSSDWLIGAEISRN